MKKIINNVRIWLIHKLGGVTHEEVLSNYKYNYHSGINFAFYQINRFANSIYGFEADRWCKAMYNFITESEKHYAKALNKIVNEKIMK